MDKNESLIHYGTPRHSGRYPYGSGENPFQHPYLAKGELEESLYKDQMSFRTRVLELRKQGYKDNEIMKKLSPPDHEIKSPEFRAIMTIGKHAQRDDDRRRALYLRDEGWSNVAIAEKLYGSKTKESTVRGLLNDDLAERNSRIENTAEQLKKAVDEKGMIDVGKGVNLELNVSPQHLSTAIHILKQQGYKEYPLYVPQATDPYSRKATTQKILVKPDISYKYMMQNQDQIGAITVYTPDRGKNYAEIQYPSSIKDSRVKIRYAEDGGKSKDGVIEIRPGVEDLNLGGNHYAQVRIAVNDSHFLKGMAIYGDPKNFPPGVDVIFNTNKHVGTNKMDVLKPFKEDPRTGEVDRTNPFGALLRAKGQNTYTGSDGKEHLSAINIVKQEGDWAEQSRTVASQMLSKQSIPLIKKQLALSYAEYQSKFEELKTLTNPSIKQQLLYSYADKCDKAAAHLKATAFPRQEVQVILPVDSLKDNEIYAPKYRNGETVALVRYPHAGPFELPVLKVNNKNAEGKRVITPVARDAVGINSKVADILSGADFDGDTVSVIPVNSRIKLINSSSSEAIKVSSRLKGFDPKEAYPKIEGMKLMTKENTQNEMGKISNLITDMTIKGANADEVSKAVKHSMVVIDAEKHELNYQQSYKDNGIRALKIKYQGISENGQPRGASTLISRAKAKAYIDKRSLRFDINPETGEKIYRPLSEKDIVYYTKTGKEKRRQDVTYKMSTVNDAFELSTGHPIETEYAKYANSLKSLANQCRKEAYHIKPIEKNTSAAHIYAPEVASLTSKLNQALKNAPRERMAQRIANKQINDTIRAFKNNPNYEDLDKKEKKKLRQQSIANARASVGAGGAKIKDITDREWKAIQSGAIAKSTLDEIIKAMDEDKLKELALPKSNRSVSTAKQNIIKAKLASGWTLREVADSVGVSVSTVSRIANS